MRLDLRYLTRFRYEGTVRESANELRACPVSDDRQQLVSYRVTTTPASRTLSWADYWGTRVDAFEIRQPHDVLEVLAEATVETAAATSPTGSPRWAALTAPDFLGAHVEYLQPSAHTQGGPAVAELARRRVANAGDDLISAVLALHRTVGTQLTYAPGATYVGVPVDEVLECGEGVCQDFAHLVIALCRSLGIPARYVSGYLFARNDATGELAAHDEPVTVQTHAWIEVAIPGYGWWPLDPTNGIAVGEQHVKIGHGRDYDDVPPLKGVFSGPGGHDLDVSVEMRRQHSAQSQQ